MEPAESVPSVTAKPWVWKVCVGFAVAIVATMLIAAAQFKMHEADPGADACDHITDTLKHDGTLAAAWDQRMERAARLLESAAVSETLTGTQRITIDRHSPDARCHDVFRVAYHVWQYKKFAKLQSCAEHAATLRDESRCLDDAGL